MKVKPVFEIADAPTTSSQTPVTPAPATPPVAPFAVPSGTAVGQGVEAVAPAAPAPVAPAVPVPAPVPAPTLADPLLTPPPAPEPAPKTVPEKYAVKIPDGILPPGVNLPLDADQPFVKELSDWAKANGLSQEAYEQQLTRLVQASIAHLPNAQKEIESLGDGGQDRVKRVVQWYRGKVSPEAYRALSQFGVKADYFKALEEVMELAGEPRFAPTGVSAPPTGITKAKVETMMQDPRYWRDHDPHYIAEVEHAWKQVVGNGVHKSSGSSPNTGRRRAE